VAVIFEANFSPCRACPSLTKHASQIWQYELLLFTAQMFIKPWHNFNEIAGAMSKIELLCQNFIPRIAASAGASRQSK
jgi:hypothetical protein